jgi:hypothetical protein
MATRECEANSWATYEDVVPELLDMLDKRVDLASPWGEDQSSKYSKFGSNSLVKYLVVM